jgi:hypothetical protein
MGILDEAIREHLELKRQHGADDSELKQLEDDAFGPPRRPGAEESAPDAASEAATEFMAPPDLGGDGEVGQAEEPQESRPIRREPVADVQEAPEHAEEEEHPDELAEEEQDEPAEEEQPAGEHEVVPPPQPSHTTEERHAIADQPTEMYDVEGEFAPTEASDPSDEELVAEEITEPRLGPPAPIGDLEDEAEEQGEPADEQGEADEDDDFFDEQRLSDELDQALEAPLEPESEEGEQSASEDVESEEGEHEADSEEVEPAELPADEDVLEETPDFLEEAPEDDQLWFEQKPPKDFDFDD